MHTASDYGNWDLNARFPWDGNEHYLLTLIGMVQTLEPEWQVQTLAPPLTTCETRGR